MSKKKVGIVACSNPQRRENAWINEKLANYFADAGLEVCTSPYIYERECEVESGFSGTGKERGEFLTKLFDDPEVEEIYDISGGDLANEVLEYLDYGVIEKSKATFFGYSDMTTVINAIYTMTGKSSVLYQVRHMIAGNASRMQQARFAERGKLFDIQHEVKQGLETPGEFIEGVLVGGNIRCFLKLAGTPYFPDCTDKILLLEARGGGAYQMTTYLNQLRQMGVFGKVKGILLGTFTMMEEKSERPDIVTLVKQVVGEELPIIKTAEIGHGADSKAVRIGEVIRLERK